LLAHGLDRVAGALNDSGQVDSDQAGPVAGLDAKGSVGEEHAAVLGNASVVDHDVNATKVLLRGGEQSVDLLEIGDIAADKVGDLGVLAVSKRKIKSKKN